MPTSQVELPRSVVDYYARVGAEILNFRRAIIKQFFGTYYKERAVIKLGLDGTVKCNVKEYEPTEDEAELMRVELLACVFPKSIRATNLYSLLPKLQGPYFSFIDQKTQEIIMVQERRDDDKGKHYIPWSFMSNGEWMAMEPDDGLPFWKPTESQGADARIMIHEGAKAAKAITDMLANGGKHPWADYLEDFEHWGMVGGAMAPHRSLYEELKARNPSEVIYACDRDKAGESALPKVSKHWGRSMKGMVFGDQFPQSWDMADPIPEALMEGNRYIGTLPQQMLQSATWATEMIPNPSGKGREVAVLTHHFEEEWIHCVQPDVYCHREWPNRILSATEFDDKISPFSHVKTTSDLMKKCFVAKADILKYDPSLPSGIYSEHKQRLVNTYEAPLIQPEAGDVGPWIEYLNHLVPDDGDRHQLMRWVATLISKPAIRMQYGVLLVSETQGVGKGTLGEKILKYLVGHDNVSFPSEQTIVDSQYNYWIAHRRLAVCHEIYAGSSSKAYNKLKSIITDRDIEVKKKYQADYHIENWVHILAMSNSRRALKIDDDDRRWFIPEVVEGKKSEGYWSRFNAWLKKEGGLSFILHWAKEFTATPENCVGEGERAPESAAKRELIREGYSPGQLIVERALRQISDQIEDGHLPDTTFVLDTDLVKLIKDELYEGRHNDHLERPATVRKLAKALGWYVGASIAHIASWGKGAHGARIIAFRPDIANKTPGQLGGSDIPENERMRPFEIRAQM